MTCAHRCGSCTTWSTASSHGTRSRSSTRQTPCAGSNSPTMCSGGQARDTGSTSGLVRRPGRCFGRQQPARRPHQCRPVASAGRARGAGRAPGRHRAPGGGRRAGHRAGLRRTSARPLFVTVTRTVGQDRGHLDVSLWFVLAGKRGMTLAPDASEIREARWWSPPEVLAEDPRRLDPHHGRFAMKVTHQPMP